MEYDEIEKEKKKAATLAAPSSPSGDMTLRERFQRVMHYQHADKIPNFEFGYWTEIYDLWRQQGLPESVVDEDTAYEYFGIEKYSIAPVSVGLKFFALGGEIIEETPTRRIERDIFGAICEVIKEGTRSIPRYIEFPVRDWDTWKTVKEKIEDDTGRYPDDWDQQAAQFRNRGVPLGIMFGSMIGIPRNLIGFENIALMIYEQPDLLDDIVETFCQAALRTLPRALADVQFDFALGWEDICFNSGPIVGVPFFRDVVMPRYKRITEMLRLHGVDIVHTDCDGNLSHIAPYFLEGGINTMFPVEVNGGTDPVALREQYGKQQRFWGGVDKMILSMDKAAIDAELTRLRPVVEEGGFIPTVDHRVQADAKLDLYKHYMDRKREWFNVGGEPKY